MKILLILLIQYLFYIQISCDIHVFNEFNEILTSKIIIINF